MFPLNFLVMTIQNVIILFHYHKNLVREWKCECETVTCNNAIENEKEYTPLTTIIENDV